MKDDWQRKYGYLDLDFWHFLKNERTDYSITYQW